MGYRDAYFNDSLNKSNNGWFTCAKCGRKLRKSEADIDHIFPQSCGGSDALDNLQLTCRNCNRSKGNAMDGSLEDYKNNLIRRNR